MTSHEEHDPEDDTGNDGLAVGLFLAAVLVIAGGCIALGVMALT